MLKENISGWEAMEIMRADPKNTEAFYPDYGQWRDFKWWGTSAIRLLNQDNWSVRTKQTKLDRVMEEICKDEIIYSKGEYMVPVIKVRAILEKYIKE